uniref:Uncharacterized protein n=1 Tax=Oryza glumipatula TaxID=40148 RepID=A0A0E0A4U2_9ORYZ
MVVVWGSEKNSPNPCWVHAGVHGNECVEQVFMVFDLARATTLGSFYNEDDGLLFDLIYACPTVVMSTSHPRGQ